MSLVATNRSSYMVSRSVANKTAASASDRLSRSAWFWPCLLAAAALYAPCVLASRVVVWTELRRDHAHRQAELVALQREVQHWQRIVDALQRDPEFAARLARAEFDAAPSGAVVFTPPAELAHDPRIPPAVDRPLPPDDPPYLPLLRRIAVDGPLRMRLLITSAALFLFGFLLLRDRTSPETPPRAPLLRRAVRRYLRAEEAAADATSSARGSSGAF